MPGSRRPIAELGDDTRACYSLRRFADCAKAAVETFNHLSADNYLMAEAEKKAPK